MLLTSIAIAVTYHSRIQGVHEPGSRVSFNVPRSAAVKLLASRLVLVSNVPCFSYYVENGRNTEYQVATIGVGDRIEARRVDRIQ